MTRHRQKPVSEAQTRYAHLRALIDIRLAELISALLRHEANRCNWQHPGALEVVDRKLSEAVSSFAGRGGLREQDVHPDTAGFSGGRHEAVRESSGRPA